MNGLKNRLEIHEEKLSKRKIGPNKLYRLFLKWTY